MLDHEASIPGNATRPPIQLPEVRLFIDGTWRDPIDGGSLVVVNPADEQPIAEIAAAGSSDVDLAVGAARRQFDGGDWSRLPAVQRGRLLYRIAELIERDAGYFDELEAVDIGQPSRGPWGAIDIFRYFAGWADKIDGRAVAMPDRDASILHSYVTREPLGVIGAITPWNVPLTIAAMKLAPALAAGCTVVLKPPEHAPLTTLHLAALIAEANVPPGVVNVIPGLGLDAAAPLVRHPGVDAVTFTGSPEVGRRITLQAAESFKRVTLELGGKSPQLIFADADLDAAIPQAARAFYSHGGQLCAAGTRVLVQSAIEEEVADRLAAEARQVVVGDPFEAETTVGALINSTQLHRVQGYIRRGLDEGAELLSGGQRLRKPGFFIEPTLFRGSNDLTISQDEIFGPVATVIPFEDLDDAVGLANGTRYGLSAVVWTRDLATAHVAASSIRAGTVRINGTPPPNARLPWGGYKSSGVGRENSYSALEACTEEKAVTVHLT